MVIVIVEKLNVEVSEMNIYFVSYTKDGHIRASESQTEITGESGQRQSVMCHGVVESSKAGGLLRNGVWFLRAGF